MFTPRRVIYYTVICEYKMKMMGYYNEVSKIIKKNGKKKSLLLLLLIRKKDIFKNINAF